MQSNLKANPPKPFAIIRKMNVFTVLVVLNMALHRDQVSHVMGLTRHMVEET